MTDVKGNEVGKIFVGGLAQATDDASLQHYFGQFGCIDFATVMMDNKTGRSRGFGFVKFEWPQTAELVLQQTAHVINGKLVDLKKSNVNMKGRNRRKMRIFVGGIGVDEDSKSVRTFFSKFGKVTDINLVMEKERKRHRGFAFVGFEDEATVHELTRLRFLTMGDRQVEIKAMEPLNFRRRFLLTGKAPISSDQSLPVHGPQISPQVTSERCSNQQQQQPPFLYGMLNCAAPNFCVYPNTIPPQYIPIKVAPGCPMPAQNAAPYAPFFAGTPEAMWHECGAAPALQQQHFEETGAARFFARWPERDVVGLSAAASASGDDFQHVNATRPVWLQTPEFGQAVISLQSMDAPYYWPNVGPPLPGLAATSASKCDSTGFVDTLDTNNSTNDNNIDKHHDNPTKYQ